MSHTARADMQSRWYEGHAPQAHAPATWVVAPRLEESPPPSESDAADEDWATEAIFDYYND
jgi:hypothetical protein